MPEPVAPNLMPARKPADASSTGTTLLSLAASLKQTNDHVKALEDAQQKSRTRVKELDETIEGLSGELQKAKGDTTNLECEVAELRAVIDNLETANRPGNGTSGGDAGDVGGGVAEASGRAEGDEEVEGVAEVEIMEEATDDIRKAKFMKAHPNVGAEEQEKLWNSYTARKSSDFKAVLKLAFQKQFGVAKLTNTFLPSYPDLVLYNTDDNAWPRDPSTKQALLRFAFDFGYTHEINQAEMKRFKVWFLLKGPSIWPQFAWVIDHLLETDLDAVLKEKFQEFQGKKKKLNQALGVVQSIKEHNAARAKRRANKEEGVSDDELDPSNLPASLSTQTLESRRKTVLKVRIRKRDAELLRPDPDPEFADVKWNQALQHHYMSDFEDEYEAPQPNNPYTKGKAMLSGNWIRRQQTWRHDRLNRFMNHVEALEDPTPPPGKCRAKILGVPVEHDLPHCALHVDKVRPWMVEETWIAEHPSSAAKYMTVNGKLWGNPDDQEPADLDAAKAAADSLKTMGKGTRKRVGATLEAKGAKKSKK